MKRKKLKKINKQFIRNNQVWVPPLKNKYKIKSDSFFDITASHRKPKGKPILRMPISNEIRSRPIFLYPTLKQRRIIFEWFEVYRIVYNKTVSYFKTHPLKSFWTVRPIIKDLFKDNIEFHQRVKKSKILVHTLDNAIDDCVKAYDSALSNKSNGNILGFKLRYKKQSHHLKTLVLEPSTFSKEINGFRKSVLGKMESSEPLTGIKKACRLSYNNRTGVLVLRVPYDKKTVKFCARNNVIALDGGIRTFMTGYSPAGIGYEFCTANTNNKLKKIINEIETVKKVCSSGKLLNYNRYLKRKREKLSNMVADLHWKVAKFLCEKFDIIYLGKLSTTGICKRNGNLSAENKRLCYALSHYTFRERLKSKAAEYQVIFKAVDESYTSKTCGKCGEIDENLGAKKIFKCPQEACGFKIARDYNGARNILLKTCSTH
jgi:putative transposase